MTAEAGKTVKDAYWRVVELLVDETAKALTLAKSLSGNWSEPREFSIEGFDTRADATAVFLKPTDGEGLLLDEVNANRSTLFTALSYYDDANDRIILLNVGVKILDGYLVLALPSSSAQLDRINEEESFVESSSRIILETATLGARMKCSTLVSNAGLSSKSQTGLPAAPTCVDKHDAKAGAILFRVVARKSHSARARNRFLGDSIRSCPHKETPNSSNQGERDRCRGDAGEQRGGRKGVEEGTVEDSGFEQVDGQAHAGSAA
eukprot:CAMPEP_0198323982 /NCGR_PEP_ID=MMETSP1450-20131203/12079_1 /TAXON_ID=753684 ORGANISM="Madagascaria erythrocladiodes, Strain CCMP3234" /NCGR_SAMPLE_ID=MMETSP1450 /ASSEMBLY_ACC=CAM_ASM_001115 /LENGTH=262 /DNA_ID=CAMNT_0044027733 /DNA_START=212 /DNA_END=1001 /DNA_ORIENTATION=+